MDIRFNVLQPWSRIFIANISFYSRFHFHLRLILWTSIKFVYTYWNQCTYRWILHETLFLDIRGTKIKIKEESTHKKISFFSFSCAIFVSTCTSWNAIYCVIWDLHTHRHNGFDLDALLKWRRLFIFFVYISNFYADGTWTRMLWL